MDKRRFYDWLSRYYGIVGLFDDCYKRKALEFFDLKRGMRFLDVGCGAGFVLRQVKRRYQSVLVFGVDSSCKMAACARKDVLGGVSCGDCFCLPFRDGSFDVLFCSFVFDIFDFSEQKKVLSEFSRVLVPGGRLIFVNNVRGTGVFFWLSGFYVILARIFPKVLLNKPIDASFVVEMSGFAIKKRKVAGFTEILVCEKIWMSI
ncbi:MAG: hypothetical protein DRP85_08200 [Candidatus Makaraimicrobium thalassicum]|nr:MAG: hypothetical protein DRP85_08200 [Candidatus Omnitrophota bacterium]